MTAAVYGTVTPGRLELVERMRELRNHGLTQAECATRLGISRSYASELERDPDGSRTRRRKETYRQPCPRCGKPMSGGQGKARTPSYCGKCTWLFLHEDRHWTPAQIISSFKAFAKVAGRAPSTVDVMADAPTIAAQISLERRMEARRLTEQVRLPPQPIVAREFGSWTAAVRAAGLTPLGTGTPSHRVAYRAARETLALLQAGPMTALQVASVRGVTRETASVCLNRLVRKGQLVRSRDGYAFVYSLPVDA